MITDHSKSKTLHVFSVIILVVAGILLILDAFAAMTEIDTTVITVFLVGLCLFFFSFFLDGFAILVEDAEVRLIAQSKEQLRIMREKQRLLKEKEAAAATSK